MQQDSILSLLPLVACIVVLVVVIVALTALVQIINRRNAHKSLQDVETEDDTAAIPSAEPLPYRLTPLLTDAERRFFEALQAAVASRAMICPKVGLGDLFRVEHRDYKKRSAYWKKINRKHVDFVLCDPRTLLPLLAIELDDSSHARSDRQQRDAFVDQVYAAAGLPLLHITGRRSYDVSVLQLQLQPFLGDALVLDPPPPLHRAEEPVTYQPQQVGLIPHANEPQADAVQAPPTCPQCGSVMVLRTAVKGKYAGERFWGCSNYPDCRAFIRYE